MQTTESHFRRSAVLLVLVAIAALFLWLIRAFLIPLLMAAVFSSLATPLYGWICKHVGNRRALASALTLLILILCVIGPLLGLLSLIADQAITVSQEVMPWIEAQVAAQKDGSLQLPEWIPYSEQISASQITAKIGQLVDRIGNLLMQNLSAASRGTAEFLLDLFVMLYAMYTFFIYGGGLRKRASALFPLPENVKKRLFEKGRSVARATLKGTIVVGLIQGLLGGVAFQIAGVSGAALWGLVMAVASVIPAIGTALVWVPAVGYLFIVGETGWGIGLTIWFILVVGSIDNILRPKLVGGDSQLPDLLVLISTLGGIAVFGMAGLLIGPIVAAIFVTMLDVYQVSFRDELTPPSKIILPDSSSQ